MCYLDLLVCTTNTGGHGFKYGTERDIDLLVLEISSAFLGNVI